MEERSLDQSEDSFTFYIQTEKDGAGCDVILIRHNIKTRGKNIGANIEYVNDDVNQPSMHMLDHNRAGSLWRKTTMTHFSTLPQQGRL
jgi:hypothetical protein